MRWEIDWGCHGGWVKHGGKHPHIKAAMHSAINVDDADELLIILGIMIERMQDEALKNHIIIPVTWSSPVPSPPSFLFPSSIDNNLDFHP